MVRLSTGAGSKQNYQTPKNFINAAVNKFGRIAFDLAADESNAQAKDFYTEADDSLKQDWVRLTYQSGYGQSVLWLNPPYDKIHLWAAKCADFGRNVIKSNTKLLLLVPASVGSDWFTHHVFGKSTVYLLNGRLTFVGEKQPFPRDCILAVYGANVDRTIYSWDWRHDILKALPDETAKLLTIP